MELDAHNSTVPERQDKGRSERKGVDLESENPLTLDQLKKVVPRKYHTQLSEEFTEELNDLIDDPAAREVFRENLISYTSVLQEPQIGLHHYIQAIRYVSFKMLGHTNISSWIRTFPERYQKFLDQEKDEMFITRVVSQYNKSKTVALIMRQTLVPTWILNQDLYQKALNTQADLMINARSEKVRSDAANSLLTHLKQPEATKISMDVQVKEDDSVRELREATLELVKQQKLSIESGANSARDIAEARLIPGEFERVD